MKLTCAFLQQENHAELIRIKHFSGWKKLHDLPCHLKLHIQTLQTPLEPSIDIVLIDFNLTFT